MCFSVFLARFLLQSFVCVCVFVWKARMHGIFFVSITKQKYRKNGLTTNYFIPFHSIHFQTIQNGCGYLYMCVCIQDAEWNQRIYYNQFILFFVRVKRLLIFFHSFEFEVLFFYILPFVVVVVYMRLVFYFCWSGMNWKAWS